MKHYLITLTILLLSITRISYANERIVIAGGSLTEIVYALSAGEQVVAVDKTSFHPPEVQKLPNIGYWKLLNIEGILSLNPTLFITWQDSEPASIFKQVKDANVKLIVLKRTPGSPALLFNNIREISNALNQQEHAEKIIKNIETRLAATTKKIAQHPNKPTVLFLFNAGGSSMVAGKGTIADSIISLAGGNNIATNQNYSVYSSEAFIASNPDVIIMTTQSVKQLGGIENVKHIQGIEQTQAWKNQNIITIDQSFILGIGPNLADVIEELYEGLYP